VGVRAGGFQQTVKVGAEREGRDIDELRGFENTVKDWMKGQQHGDLGGGKDFG